MDQFQDNYSFERSNVTEIKYSSTYILEVAATWNQSTENSSKSYLNFWNNTEKISMAHLATI